MNNLEQALQQILQGGDITIDCDDIVAFNEFCGKYNRKYGIRCSLDQVTNKVRIQKTDNRPIGEETPPSPPPAPPSEPDINA
jgi:hypothetical protein